MIVFQYVAAVLVGYILGSIPFGLLVAKTHCQGGCQGIW